MLYTSTKYPKEPKAGQETGFDIHKNFWILIVVVVLAICFIAAVIMMAVLLICRLKNKRQKKDIPRDVIRRGDPEIANKEVETELLSNAEQSQQQNDDFEDPISNGGQVSREPENDENLVSAVQESR